MTDRCTVGPPTTPADTGQGYGTRMAEPARRLRSQRTADGTLQQVVDATGELILGCNDVSISSPDATAASRPWHRPAAVWPSAATPCRRSWARACA